MAVNARFQVTQQVGSLLPRDRIMINPCFRDETDFPAADWDALAGELLDALLAWGQMTGELRCKVYDLEGTPPVLPMGEAVRAEGTFAQPSTQRELALCLSYSGGQHQPRQRGRLYVPHFWFGGSTPVRPSGTQQSTVLSLGAVLADLGDEDLTHVVWSQVANDSTKVTRYWVDDEWDVQRRRGPAPSGRIVDVRDG